MPFLLCGSTAPSGCPSGNDNIGPGKGAVVAGVAAIAGAAVGTVVLVEVHHKRHFLKGCILSGADGFQLETFSDHKTYILDGDSLNLKPGELVQLHGSRVKRAGSGSATPVFRIEKLSRDFGPCKTATSTAASASGDRLSPARLTNSNQIK
jgi:hypothetical protein